MQFWPSASIRDEKVPMGDERLGAEASLGAHQRTQQLGKSS
jgi:hypothetical protein